MGHHPVLQAGLPLLFAPLLSAQGFTLLTWPEFAFDGSPDGSIVAADMNGDGLPDVVRRSGVAVNVGTNLGDGRFQELVFQVPGPGVSPVAWRLPVGDVNGDGRPDILVPFWGFGISPTRQPELCVNLGNGTFAWDTTGRLPPAAAHSYGAVFHDIDNDGDLDAMIFNEDADDVLLLNDGTGRFTDVTQTRLPPTLFAGNTRDIAFADLDGDGFADLVRGGWDTTSFTLLNDGTGHFVQGQTLGNWRTKDIQFADIDGDGDLDVWFCGRESGDRLYLNVGSGYLVDVTSRLVGLLGPGFGVGSRGAAFGDYDEDGDVDVVIATRTSTGTLHVYVGPVLLENDGTGHFTNTTLTNMGGISVTANDVTSADFDGDGDLDVVVMHEPVLFSLTRHALLFNMKRHVRCAPAAIQGTTHPLELYAEAGHVLVPALSTGPAWVPIAGYGILALDPTILAVLPLAMFATTRRIDSPLPIPMNQALAGQRFYAQALDLWTGTGGMLRAHFTNRTSLVVQ